MECEFFYLVLSCVRKEPSEEWLLNSRLMTKRYLKHYYNNNPTNVPVTKKIKSLSQAAYKDKGEQNYLVVEKKQNEKKQILLKSTRQIGEKQVSLRKAKEMKQDITVFEEKLKEAKKSVAIQSNVSSKLLDKAIRDLKVH